MHELLANLKERVTDNAIQDGIDGDGFVATVCGRHWGT
jgi:hypothetical protein